MALTGPSAGGKGTVAEMLKEKDYVYFSCSDVLREVAEKRGWDIGRETLQNLGDELREKYGNDILPRWIASLPEFKKSYERELGVHGGSAMQVEECLKIADLVITNDRAPEYLKAEAEKAFTVFGIEAHVHGEDHEVHHEHDRH